ncbi:MAG: isochorismatase family protein [Candidimonas sp.]|nr:MAG: isochorismatase family protein [Candidimonas sp.]TAM22062.1 MAG: isochorismatase family protein [Candidimonas sp.]TAM74871.1 MAG: isochorismatase family protein [Candidimonas sp.]
MSCLAVSDSLLLVVDMQARLLPAIRDGQDVLARAQSLAQAACLLGVPVMATEHCVEKIGATVPQLQAFIPRIVRKTHFDATREPGFAAQLPKARPNVLLIGTEAHVCVLQTAIGLMALGLRPILVADCVGSRRLSDLQAAINRAVHHHIEVVTSEMAMFEWLETGDSEHFKAVLALIKSH